LNYLIDQCVSAEENENSCSSVLYNTIEWDNLFLDDGWKIIDVEIFTSSLCKDVFTKLYKTKSIFITENIELISLLFRKEIEQEDIYILGEEDIYLMLNNTFNLVEKKNRIIVASLQLPYIHRIIKEGQWDFIIADLTQEQIANLKETLFPILKTLYHLSKNIIVVKHPNSIRSLRKSFPKFSSMFYYPINYSNITIKPCVSQDNSEKMLWIEELISNTRDKGVIFVAQREEGELLETYLLSKGHSVIYVIDDFLYYQKRYIEDRFNSEFHFDPLQIIIINELTQLIDIPTEIKWTIHYNFSSGLKDYLKEIIWCSTGKEKLASYLFYSYQDKILRNRMIKENYPSLKSIRLVYSFLNSSLRWGDQIFFDSNKFFKTLRFPKNKLKTTLGFLERKKFIKRRLSIINHMQILCDPSFINNSLSLNPSLCKILSNGRSNEKIDLVNYCNENNISPNSLTQNLLEMNANNKLIFMEKEMLTSYVLEREKYTQLKFNHYEIKKVININFKNKDLKQLEDFVNNNSCTQSNFNIDDNNPTLTNSIRLGILQLVKESPFPIGKHLISQTLTGSHSKKISKLNLDNLLMYNSFSLIKADKILKIVILLIMEQYLEEISMNNTSYKALRISKKGESWLNKGLKLNLWKQHQKSFSNQKESIYPVLKKIMNDENYESVSESTLRSISLFKPRTIEELNMIKGVNSNNIKRLSNLILSTFKQVFINNNSIISNNKLHSKLEEINNFLNEKYFPKLSGNFIKGYSLSSYTILSEGNRRYTPIGKAIHNYKYRNKRVLPEIITQKALSLMKVEKDFELIDFITFVPSSCRLPSIAEELAIWLSKALKIPLYDNIIVRCQDNKLQKSMETLDQKENNAKNLFKITLPKELKNASILLIDDIYDSGITINTLTHLFKKSGVKNIYVLTCARTAYRDI